MSTSDCDVNMKISFVDESLPDINNEDILQDTFTMTESICSGDGIKFGANEASQIKFSCYSEHKLKNKTIDCVLEVDITSLVYRPAPEAGHDYPNMYWSEERHIYIYPIYYGRYIITSFKRRSEDMGICDIEANSWGYEKSRENVQKNNIKELTDFERAKFSFGVDKNIPYTFNLANFVHANIVGVDIGSETFDEMYDREYLEGENLEKKERYNYAYTGCVLEFNYYCKKHTFYYKNADALYHIISKVNKECDAEFVRIADEAAKLAVEYSPNKIEYDSVYNAYLNFLRTYAKPYIHLSLGYPSPITKRTRTPLIYPFINLPSNKRPSFKLEIEIPYSTRGILFNYGSFHKLLSTDYYLLASGLGQCKLKDTTISPMFSIPRTDWTDDEDHEPYYVCDNMEISLADYAKCFAELNAVFGLQRRNIDFYEDGSHEDVSYHFKEIKTLEQSFKSRIGTSDYSTCWYDEDSIPYGKVRAEYTENGKKVSAGAKIKKPDGQYYTNDDEFFTYDFSDNLYLQQENVDYAIVNRAVNKIADALFALNSTPMILDMRGMPYIEAGDWIEVTVNIKEGEIAFLDGLVTNRTISGIQGLMDDISTETYRD